MDRRTRGGGAAARLATLGAVLKVITYALEVVVETRAARSTSNRDSCR